MVTKSLATSGFIVLAEDDPRLRRLYISSLNFAGFNVLAASDGAEALRHIESVTPRLVVLDIMMPGLDGLQTCARARNILGDKIPILFLSALDSLDVLRNCLAAGGDDYLIKSASIGNLVERIKSWLNHPRKHDLAARRAELLAKVEDEAGPAKIG